MAKIQVQYYYLGLRKKSDPDDIFYLMDNYNFKEIKFPFGKRYWAADPFIVENGYDVYIFYEYFDEFRGKGSIACSKVVDNVASKPVIIIDEAFHLSFPMFFENKNCLYMIPESEASNSVILYKCISFPYKWEKDKVILNNVKACDSVVLQNDLGQYLLITSLMDEKSTNERKNFCYVHNVMYELDEELNIIPHSKKELSEGDYGIRNAGKIIKTKNTLIRIAQNCTEGMYGKGLVFWALDSYNPYKEHELANIDYEKACNHITHIDHNGKIEGIHTYNCSAHYEIIDFMIFNELPVYYKLYYFLGNRIFKIITKIERLIRN